MRPLDTAEQFAERMHKQLAACQARIHNRQSHLDRLKENVRKEPAKAQSVATHIEGLQKNIAQDQAEIERITKRIAEGVSCLTALNDYS